MSSPDVFTIWRTSAQCPLTAEIGRRVWGTAANFKDFRVLALLLQRRRSPEAPNFAQCLAVFWAGTLNIHFPGAFAPKGILPGAKLMLRPSLAISYIGSFTARHSSSWRVSQTLQRGTRNGITELSHTAPPVFGRAAITF